MMDRLSDSSGGSIRNVSSIPLLETQSLSKTTQTDGVNYVYCVDSNISNKGNFDGVSESWKSQQYFPMYPMYNNPLVSPVSLCQLQSFTSRSLCHFPMPWYPFQSFGPYLPLNVSPPLVQIPMVLPPTPCHTTLTSSNHKPVNKNKNYHVSPNNSLSNVSVVSVTEIKDCEVSSTQDNNKKPLRYYRFNDDDRNEINSSSRNTIKQLQQKYLKNNSKLENLQNTHLSDTSICPNSFTKKMNEAGHSVTRSSIDFNGSSTASNLDKDTSKKRRSQFLTSFDSSDVRNRSKMSSSSSRTTPTTSSTQFKSGSKFDRDGKVNGRNVIKRYISRSLSKPINFESKSDEDIQQEAKQHDKVTTNDVKKIANLLCDFDSNHNLDYANSDFYNSVIRRTIDVALSDNKCVRKQKSAIEDVQKSKKIKLSCSNDYTVADSDGSTKGSKVNLLEQPSKSNSNLDNISKYRSLNIPENQSAKIDNLMESDYNSRSRSRLSNILEKSIGKIENLIEYNLDNRSKKHRTPNTTETPIVNTDKNLSRCDKDFMESDYENRSMYRSSNRTEKSNSKTDNSMECDDDDISTNGNKNSYNTGTVFYAKNNNKFIDEVQLLNQHSSHRNDMPQLTNHSENTLKNYENTNKRASSVNHNQKDYSYSKFTESDLCKTSNELLKSVKNLTASCCNKIDNKVTNLLNDNYDRCKVTNPYSESHKIDKSNNNYKPDIVQNNDSKTISNKNNENNEPNLECNNKKDTKRQIEIRKELIKINESFIKDNEKRIEQEKAKKKTFENITAHFILPTVGKNEVKKSTNDPNLSNKDDKNFTKFSFSVNYDPTNPEMIVVDCEQDGKNLSESTINNNNDDPCLMSFDVNNEPTVIENTTVNNDDELDFTENDDLCNNFYGNYWQMDDIPNSVSSNSSSITPKRRTRFSQYSMLNNIETLSIISEEDEGSYATNRSTTTITSNADTIDTFVLNQNCTGDVKRFKNAQQVKSDKEYFR